MSNSTLNDLRLYIKKEPDNNKVIKHCRRHGTLYLKDVNKDHKNIDGSYTYRCKQCQKENQKKFYERKATNVLNKCKEYREKNKEKVKEFKKKSFQKHGHKYLESSRLYQQKASIELKDWYVRKAILNMNRRCNSNETVVTPQMIELKRTILTLKREITKVKNRR